MELLQYPKEYQNYIDLAPVPEQEMWKRSTASDTVTIETWRQTWIDQYRACKAHFGTLGDFSVGQLHDKHLHAPAVLIGSGPHLRDNAHALKDKPKGAIYVSCLHNFHFLEDLQVDVDYYVSLDSGPVVLEEIAEGGDGKDYWELTRGKTLIAFVGSHPDLWKKWQGKIFLFNCPTPDQAYATETEAIEKFNAHLSTGGNVLGACWYFAKAFLGCSTSIFVGASFCFDNATAQFHPWKSKYDAKVGQVIRVPDIFGYKVKTWPSYYNFANWFNLISQRLPGEVINATEGGCLGAYLEGNIRSIKQMKLEHALERFRLTRHTQEQADNPQTSVVKVLW